MSVQTQLEREENNLEQMLANGEITKAEFNSELMELHRSYRGAAEEAALDAYEAEMANWY